VSCFIDKNGKVNPLLPGCCHAAMALRLYRCKLETALKKGIVRIRIFESLTQKIFCLECGKPLTKQQKEAIIEQWPGKVTQFVWSIAGKDGDCFHDTGLKLIALLGV
jgi:hypothetical protein